MKKILIIPFFLLFNLSCSLNYDSHIFNKKRKKKTYNSEDVKINNNSNFDIYKNKLMIYSKNKQFPNINK